MINNFWQQLNKPFFVLAPMYDVTDAAFRYLIAKYGKPDVIMTEFVSCDGLCSPGRKNIKHLIKFHKSEQPIVAQVFGNNLDTYYKTAQMLKKKGFAGIDINMGCPDKAVIKQGSGSALIKTPKLAQELIKAAQAGADPLPVSVKTRLGLNKNEIKTWLPALLETKPAAITIHARTKKQMSKVSADWEQIKLATEIAKGSGVLIIGNGDVQSLEHGQELAKKTKADGIMVGRSVFGNPWFFNKNINIEDITLEQKLKVMLEHTKLYEKYFKGIKNFHIMKKHFKAYIKDFDGAKELRMKLMDTDNCEQVDKIIKDYLTKKTK